MSSNDGMPDTKKPTFFWLDECRHFVNVDGNHFSFKPSKKFNEQVLARSIILPKDIKILNGITSCIDVNQSALSEK